MTRGVSTLRSKQYAEHGLSVVNDTGESIFEYEYLHEYKAKIENIRCTYYGSYDKYIFTFNSKIQFAGLSH